MGEMMRIYSVVPRSDVPCEIPDLDVTRFINVQHYILRIVESEGTWIVSNLINLTKYLYMLCSN
jgi:hypothetical protein